MYNLLLFLLAFDALILTAAVLLQAGQGGGLASLGGGAGTEQFMGGRQATTLLTKITWWCAGIFLSVSLVLAFMSSNSAAPRSVLDSDHTSTHYASVHRSGWNQPKIPWLTDTIARYRRWLIALSVGAHIDIARRPEHRLDPRFINPPTLLLEMAPADADTLSIRGIGPVARLQSEAESENSRAAKDRSA